MVEWSEIMYKNITKVMILLLIFLGIIQGGVLAQEPTYILGPEDLLEVTVWNHPDLNKTISIRSDGFISLPLVGDVFAEGLTPEQLGDKIAGLLEEYLVSPQVTVAVQKFKMLEVSVLGAVVRQGIFPVKSDTRLLEVLALAGIEEKQALLEEVTLTRNDTNFTIDVDKLLKAGGYQNFLLQSGDVIYVPFVNRVVYILGQVKLPGSYRIDQKTTPADILAMAGGPTERADLKNVKIIHRDGNQEIEVINLENFLDNRPPETIIYLTEGDIIKIEETKAINWEKIFTYAAGIKVIHDLIVNW